jgi:hypothetical protein
MADTRINALSTATVSLSDDFLPIDGTTAGTKKLSAYNPSFGGNATVGGTLAVSSTATSSSTTTGALVVSGGVGVAGAGYFGGLLNISSTAGLYAQWKKTDNASGSQSWAWILNNDGTLFLQAANDNFVGANNYISFARSGVTPGTTTIHGTTASTSTSSGALVVSGGVGVAGNTNIGGVASVGGSSNASVGVYVINTALTGTDQYGVASEPIWTSAATSGYGIWARTKTAASAFTLTNGQAFLVDQPTLGAGSSITNTYGMRVRNQGAAGVTNAYGLYVESQSGAATLNYAIYTAGGRINFQGLPTSSSGLPAGTLWNDSGTLKVA